MNAIIRRLRRLEDRFGPAVETEFDRKLLARIEAGRRRLVLNDAVKAAMIKWRVLNAVAGKPADVPATFERMKMQIDSKDFRVREGDKVNLKKWPTYPGRKLIQRKQRQQVGAVKGGDG
jgi:hypothetical protein